MQYGEGLPVVAWNYNAYFTVAAALSRLAVLSAFEESSCS